MTLDTVSALIKGNLDQTDIANAQRIRAGQISINGGARGPAAPFGGFNTSGNGREHGMSGLMECLETKAIIGN